MPKSATRKKVAKQKAPTKKIGAQKKMSFFQRLMMKTSTSSKYVRTPRGRTGTRVRYNVAIGSTNKIVMNLEPLSKSNAKALRNKLNDSLGGGPYRVCVAR